MVRSNNHACMTRHDIIGSLSQELFDAQQKDGTPESERLSQQEIEELMRGNPELRAGIEQMRADQESADQEAAGSVRENIDRIFEAHDLPNNVRNGVRIGSGTIRPVVAPAQFGIMRMLDKLRKGIVRAPANILKRADNFATDFLKKHDPWTQALSKAPIIKGPFNDWWLGKSPDTEAETMDKTVEKLGKDITKSNKSFEKTQKKKEKDKKEKQKEEEEKREERQILNDYDDELEAAGDDKDKKRAARVRRDTRLARLSSKRQKRMKKRIKDTEDSKKDSEKKKDSAKPKVDSTSSDSSETETKAAA